MTRPLTAIAGGLATSPASASTTASRTLTAAPLRALEQRWAEQLRILSEWSDPSASRALARALSELREALEHAERQETRLSAKEAVRRFNMAASTLNWLCRQHGAAIDAVKVRGEWYVDRAKLEAYLSSQRGGRP